MIEVVQQTDWHVLLGMASGGIVTALLTGKFIRRLLITPFDLIAEKTATQIDDKLVEEAKKDLGLEDSKEGDK
jgi:hypothetical protein